MNGELDLAQQLLARLEKDYQNERLDSVKKWNQEFLKMATAKREQAIAATRRQRLSQSPAAGPRKRVPETRYCWRPDLIREIDTIYPLVNVGVLQSATVFEPTRLDNWGARRAGRLLYRTLFEMQGAGPEGGEYDFIFGDVEMSPDRMHFDLLLETENARATTRSRSKRIFWPTCWPCGHRLDSPTYFAPWAAACRLDRT